MKLISILILCILICVPTNGIKAEVYNKIPTSKNDSHQSEKVSIPVLDFDKIANKTVIPDVKLNNNAVKASTVQSDEISSATTKQLNQQPAQGQIDDLLQSGALLRGFYVLVGITVLCLLYLGYRMFRLRKGGQRPTVLVRKYGVLTNRSDVEMVPLPLDEEDDDDTVFELNNQVESH